MSLKVTRHGTGWYSAHGERYDYEFLNEDGWQLMVYRAGTFEVTKVDTGGLPYYAHYVADGEAIYAVTVSTKRSAVAWANAFEDGSQKLDEFVEADPEVGFQGGYS